MREKYKLGAFPLLLRGWDFTRLQLPSPKVRNRVDNDPRYTTPEVDDFMQDEAHKASRNGGVVEPEVPLRPLQLKPI